MFEEKKYFCNETENSYTESELREFYNEFHDEGETFAEYVNSCLVENNGTLITPRRECTFRLYGKEITFWNLRSNIGRLAIVHRCGCVWKAEDGTVFSLYAEYKSGYTIFCNETDGSLYSLKKRIFEDVAVLQTEE